MTGIATETPAYVEAGLRSLRWLMTLQTTPAGLFRPVGTQGFGDERQPAAGVRSAAAGSHGDDLGLPCGLARRWRRRMESRSARAYSPGSSAAMICRSRWSIWKPGAAAMACIPTARTRTGAANPWCPIFSAFAEIRQIAPPEREPREDLRRASLDAREHCTISVEQSEEASLSHIPFLNRQALYLRPDPARVIVRPFKPATEPRDLNPTDKTRANHIVDRVLALDAETAAQPAGRCAGELSGPSPQPAARHSRRAPTKWKTRLAVMPFSRKMQRNWSAPISCTNIRSKHRRCSIRASSRIPDQSGAPEGGLPLHPEPSRGR